MAGMRAAQLAMPTPQAAKITKSALRQCLMAGGTATEGTGRLVLNDMEFLDVVDAATSCAAALEAESNRFDRFDSTKLPTHGFRGKREGAATHPRLCCRARRGLSVDCFSCLLYTSDAADDLLCVDLG